MARDEKHAFVIIHKQDRAAPAILVGPGRGRGCFGGGGAVEPGRTTYGRELLRDVGFLLMAGWLVVRPRTLGVLSAQRERV